MDEILREGLEAQLLVLEDSHERTVGDLDPPLVCALCYSQDECNCAVNIRWPVGLVLVKLRAELSEPA